VVEGMIKRRRARRRKIRWDGNLPSKAHCTFDWICCSYHWATWARRGQNANPSRLVSDVSLKDKCALDACVGSKLGSLP
jgi:hypothetical protein